MTRVYRRQVCPKGHPYSPENSYIDKRGDRSCKICMKARAKVQRKKLSPLFGIWNGMWQRCTNPKTQGYQRYGGRGISVCDRWKSFELFKNDMGARPSSKHSIDRINNDGNYEPGNCRWATMIQQGANTSKCKLITYGGETLTTTQWCKRLGISLHAFRIRARKYGKEKAISLGRPVVPGGRLEAPKPKKKIDPAPQKGDYVLASKYSDGDPADPFAIGIYDGNYDHYGQARHLVLDQYGNQFRHNGFRRAQKISAERAKWLCDRISDIGSPIHFFVADDNGRRVSGRSVWTWLKFSMKEGRRPPPPRRYRASESRP